MAQVKAGAPSAPGTFGGGASRQLPMVIPKPATGHAELQAPSSFKVAVVEELPAQLGSQPCNKTDGVVLDNGWHVFAAVNSYPGQHTWHALFVEQNPQFGNVQDGPIGDALQAVAPALKLPEQGMHMPWPAIGLNCPVGHSVHPDAPAREKLPGSHNVQGLTRATEYVPAGQVAPTGTVGVVGPV